jgi:hypothetical protein
MTERDKDYYKGQLIYEKLDGVPESQKASQVLEQLATLYPGKGEQYFVWWLQARNAGIIEEE